MKKLLLAILISMTVNTYAWDTDLMCTSKNGFELHFYTQRDGWLKEGFIRIGSNQNRWPILHAQEVFSPNNRSYAKRWIGYDFKLTAHADQPYYIVTLRWSPFEYNQGEFVASFETLLHREEVSCVVHNHRSRY